MLDGYGGDITPDGRLFAATATPDSQLLTLSSPFDTSVLVVRSNVRGVIAMGLESTELGLPVLRVVVACLGLHDLRLQLGFACFFCLFCSVCWGCSYMRSEKNPLIEDESYWGKRRAS